MPFCIIWSAGATCDLVEHPLYGFVAIGTDMPIKAKFDQRHFNRQPQHAQPHFTRAAFGQRGNHVCLVQNIPGCSDSFASEARVCVARPVCAGRCRQDSPPEAVRKHADVSAEDNAPASMGPNPAGGRVAWHRHNGPCMMVRLIRSELSGIGMSDAMSIVPCCNALRVSRRGMRTRLSSTWGAVR